MYYTTKLSPSCFLPVSSSYDTIRCQTPTILTTTATSDGLVCSPVMIAQRRLDRDIMEPDRAAQPCGNKLRHDKRTFQLSNTRDYFFCRAPIQQAEPKSNIGYSMSFCRYPLAIGLKQCVGTPRSGNKGGRVTNGSNHWSPHGQLPSSIDAETVQNGQDTPTWWIVSLSQVHTNVQIKTPRSSNSRVYNCCFLAHATTLGKLRGSIL